MRKFLLSILVVLPMIFWGQSDKKSVVSKNMQDIKWGAESHVIQCTGFRITPPLRELVQESSTLKRFKKKKKKVEGMPDKRDMPVQHFEYNVKTDGAEYGNDPSAVQTGLGYRSMQSVTSSLEQNWAGQSPNVSFRPFDPTGAAGPNHYLQMINGNTYEIWDKNGNSLGAGVIRELFPSGNGNGDPIALYDKEADRWFMSQFGGSGDNGIYIAISQTSDPLGEWYAYEFESPDFPDYLKFSAWQDGYYMTANYEEKIFAFNRTKMLAGDPTAEAVYQTFSPPNSGFFVPLPADASDGVMPGAGTPCPIFAYSDNGWGGDNIDAVNIYNASVDWNGTPTMTVTSGGVLPTVAFDASYDSSWDDIPQPGTPLKLDGIGGAMMFRAQWKTFADYNTVVLNWAVQVTSNQRGIFWCELRQDHTNSEWSIHQQGIFAPGTESYWLGSIAMNDNGDIGLSYAKSGASTYMSLAYTGRKASDPLGVMTMPEVIAMAGSGAQLYGNRVGDYSQTCLDPDGETFWHTGEYLAENGEAKTRIYSYKFVTPDLPVVIERVTDIAAVSATIEGNVIEEGTEPVTERGIVWGMSENPTIFDNKIENPSNGLGFFTADIIGLTPATTYHVRAYATNANGTAYSFDTSFTTMQTVVTNEIINITSTSATVVGTVEDGFGNVTERGVVWGMSENPTVDDNKVVDTEATLGTYSIDLANLSAGIMYHVRAYAINDNGVFYGGDKTFFTECGNVTNFPFTEGFENVNFPPNCWAVFRGANGLGTNEDWERATNGLFSTSSHTGEGAAFIQYENVPDGEFAEDWLVTPAIVLPNATASISYYEKQGYGTVYNSQYALKISTTSQTDRTSFTDLVSYDESGFSPYYSQRTVDLSNYAGQTVYLAFVMTNDGGDNWYIDDVEIDGTVATEAPVADFSVSSEDACQGVALEFTDESENYPSSWSWNFGDGSDLETVQNPTHIYNQPGVYTVTLSVQNALGSDEMVKTDYITVTESSNAGTDGAITVCEGVTLSENQLFEALGGTPDNGGTWSNNGLIYTYTVSGAAPCGDASATVTVTENPLPQASFTVNSDNAPTIEFTNTSTNATQQTWSMGDETTYTSEGVTHTYTENGVYTVVLEVSNACGTSQTEQDVNITNVGVLVVDDEDIKVYPNPVTSKLHIELPNENVFVQLINLDGKVLKEIQVKNSKALTLDMEDLVQGTYNLLLRINKDKQVSIKVIKK